MPALACSLLLSCLALPGLQLSTALPDIGPGQCMSADFTVYPQIAGHLPYPEADTLEQNVCSNGNPDSNALRPETAEAVRIMIAAAAEDGVALRAQSCFRAVDRQRAIFCSRIDNRTKTFAERVKVSAPPGFSEHATGYTIDFCDPAHCTLEQDFADTAAGRWLAENGPCFGFELSFPKDSKQGVSWEPWHWRFVGTPEAMATFATARELYPASPAVGDLSEITCLSGR